jgi:hypothetical protein
MGVIKMKIIKFTDTIGVPEEYRPVPASKIIPNWYKNLESYLGGDKRPDGNAGTTATAKRCMPIFDAITGGYIISTHTDLFISQVLDENGKTAPHYEWANFGALDFHTKKQLPDHPDGAGHEFSYPKWNNAWAIETPPGYSTLFISPLHRETPIIILPGVVDTDTYNVTVNFPFVLRDPKMDGLIPAGTPIVQVIPFKREEWQMELGTKEDLIAQENARNKLRSVFFDSYKRQFRQPKEYR